MKFAQVDIPGEDDQVGLVRLGLLGWGAPHRTLYHQAVPGYVLGLAYTHNRFDNPFHDADVNGHDGWIIFGEITGDLCGIRDARGETPPEEGWIPVVYHTELADEPIYTWSPLGGWRIPEQREDGSLIYFREKTLLPVRIVPFEEMGEAEQIYRELGLPPAEISQFYPPRTEEPRIVGRDFNPRVRDYGRFHVYADRSPSYPGGDWVASRPRYSVLLDGEPEIVMRVEHPEAA